MSTVSSTMSARTRIISYVEHPVLSKQPSTMVKTLSPQQHGGMKKGSSMVLLLSKSLLRKYWCTMFTQKNRPFIVATSYKAKLFIL
jgi:hypothetical protein